MLLIRPIQAIADSRETIPTILEYDPKTLPRKYVPLFQLQSKLEGYLPICSQGKLINCLCEHKDELRPLTVQVETLLRDAPELQGADVRIFLNGLNDRLVRVNDYKGLPQTIENCFNDPIAVQREQAKSLQAIMKDALDSIAVSENMAHDLSGTFPPNDKLGLQQATPSGAKSWGDMMYHYSLKVMNTNRGFVAEAVSGVGSENQIFPGCTTADRWQIDRTRTIVDVNHAMEICLGNERRASPPAFSCNGPEAAKVNKFISDAALGVFFSEVGTSCNSDMFRPEHGQTLKGTGCSDKVPVLQSVMDCDFNVKHWMVCYSHQLYNLVCSPETQKYLQDLKVYLGSLSSGEASLWDWTMAHPSVGGDRAKALMYLAVLFQDNRNRSHLGALNPKAPGYQDLNDVLQLLSKAKRPSNLRLYPPMVDETNFKLDHFYVIGYAAYLMRQKSSPSFSFLMPFELEKNYKFVQLWGENLGNNPLEALLFQSIGNLDLKNPYIRSRIDDLYLAYCGALFGTSSPSNFNPMSKDAFSTAFAKSPKEIIRQIVNQIRKQ
jgi:hypothetical protein